MPFRGIRSRLFAIVVVTVGVALIVGTLGLTVLLHRSTDRSINSVLSQRIVAERAVIAVRGGRIVLSEPVADVLADRVWIFEGRTAIASPRARPATEAAVRRLVGGPRRSVEVETTDERLEAAPVVGRDGRRVGTIVAVVSTAPYEDTSHAAIIGSVALACILLLVVAGAAWWLLRAALQPVEAMTRQADTWSEHDLEGRFAGGEPYDELSRLAATLDRLLDRIGASLRHERRFTAELSHEVKTPLARAIGEAELALRRERSAPEYREALELVLRNARQVARIVDTLVAAAQHAASPTAGTADAGAVAQDVAEAFAETAAEEGVELDAQEPASALRIGVDGDLAARILQPVVENACRYGRSRVTVDVADADGQIVFRVRDDGPGVGDDEREAIFEPGVRGAAANGTNGAGLGLALARRIARSVSGDVVVADGAFLVRLPRA